MVEASLNDPNMDLLNPAGNTFPAWALVSPQFTVEYQSMPKGLLTKYRLKGVGAGGWDCPCCAPNQKTRAKWCRLAKKAMYRDLDKTDFAEINIF